METNIRPLFDRVVIQPIEVDTTSSSLIFIPETARERPIRGIVLAVGPGKKDEPTTVKVGDTVLYGKYSGTEIQLDGKEVLIMKESDIFAVV